MVGRNTSMRSPPWRLACTMAISAFFRTSSRRAPVLRVVEHEADRGRQEDLALRIGDRRRDGAPDHLGEADDAVGLPLREQDHGEFVAGDAGQRVLRPQQTAERRASVSRMESPAERPTDSLTCLKRSRSMTSTVGRSARPAPRR